MPSKLKPIDLETALATFKAGDFYIAAERVEHMLDDTTTELVAGSYEGDTDFEAAPLSAAFDKGQGFYLIPEGHPLHDRCCAWLMQAKMLDTPVHVRDLITLLGEYL